MTQAHSQVRSVATWMILLAAAAVLVVPAIASAQEPVKSFDQLNTRLKPGDSIWVTDASGREIRGRILNLSAASVQIDSDGQPLDLPVARVATIKEHPKDSLRNGVLWGASVGFLIGAMSCALNPDCAEEGGAGVSVLFGVMGAAAGAGVGAGVDAAIRGPKLVVYQSSPSGPAARFSLASVIMPWHKSVVLAFTF